MEQGKAIDFTVFKDAYSAVVSGEQIKKKDEYCMLIFVFCFATCWSHFEFFDPSIEICVLEEL